jgi:hypothetical protein
VIKLLDIAHVVLEEQQTNEDFKKKAMTAALAAATALGGVNTTSKLASIPASKVTSVQNKFTKAVRGIIDNIEGAYVNPSQLTNKREKRAFRKSGETMYGIDRKTGGSINATEEGKQFWALIDADKKKNPEKWVRYYDGGELNFVRQDLIIKPEAGDIILCPSNFVYEHASLEIKSGTKYCVVIMTDYNDLHHKDH